MKSFLSLPTLLAAALLSAVVTIPFLPFAAPKAAQFQFEITATSSVEGLAQLFYDVGRGINEADSYRTTLPTGPAPQRLSFPLPAGDYRGFRFDPLDREATLTLRDALIRGLNGRVVRRFTPADFKPEQQIATHSVVGDRLELTVTPRAVDPILTLRVDTPLSLHPTPGDNLRFFATYLPPIFIGIFALIWLAHRYLVALRRHYTQLAAHPARAVMACALLAVVMSSYPVIFLGKSIVSPNLGTTLLYEAFPSLPGYRERQIAEVKGADIGAIIWQHVPLSVLQHDALLGDGELPLWNRYNSAGTVHLAQGQSMFGDPLHFFVILANGASWAWDLKYLAAKWLLACGLGLCVLRLTRHLPSALLVAFAADFIGIFPYRVNHPALFSFCYAPWMLYCWLRIATAPRWTGAARWTAGLILANWTVLNSGTAKEAYMLLLTLNFAGACALALAPLARRERLIRIGLAIWAGAIFAMLAAPVWLTFLDALKTAYTSYNTATAYQIQPSLALGLFDEIFLRPFWAEEKVYNPSANFLLLLGVLAFLVHLRVATTDRVVLALSLAALLPLALIFGLIPPAWIVRVPFLGNVAHIDNSFSCGFIVLLAVLAGVGFAHAAPRLGRVEGRGDLAIAGLLLFALVFPYIAFSQTVQRSTLSYLHWGENIPYSAFIWGSLLALVIATAGFALAMRRLLARGPSTATLLMAATCLLVIFWRHGWHAGMGFEGRVVTPMARANFHAKSPAIAAIRADQKGEPSRVVGFQGNFFHGWNDVYRLEGICGPEALMNGYYRELIDACGLVRIWDWRLYLEASNLPPLRSVYDFLNVRHYLEYKSDHDRLGAMLTPITYADLDVFRSETAWPRAFFTDRLATYDKASDFATLLKTGDGRPFAAMQTGDPAILALPATVADRAITPARNYHLTTNTTAFDIDATGPGLAVLSEAWLGHDFRVTLNGEPVHYLRVNHAFKGVMIPKSGRHHLEFTYRPRRFTLALSLCLLGAGLLGGTAWLIRRVEKRYSQPTAALPTVSA